MEAAQYIHDEGWFGKYFHALPNMYDEDLDPYEYRLIGHYKRVGYCFQSTRTTAEATKMSVGMVVKTRTALQEKGLIRIHMMTKTQLSNAGWIKEPFVEDGNEICVVTLVDVMEENARRFSGGEGCSPHEQGGVHQVNQRNTTTTANDYSTSEEALPVRPKVYGLYEQNIGALTPIISDMLKDFVKEFGEQWVEDAIVETRTSTNRPTINYMKAILDRWKAQGRGAPKPIQFPQPNQYNNDYVRSTVTLADMLNHGVDHKPGVPRITLVNGWEDED